MGPFFEAHPFDLVVRKGNWGKRSSEKELTVSPNSKNFGSYLKAIKKYGKGRATHLEAGDNGIIQSREELLESLS